MLTGITILYSWPMLPMTNSNTLVTEKVIKQLSTIYLWCTVWNNRWAVLKQQYRYFNASGTDTAI